MHERISEREVAELVPSLVNKIGRSMAAETRRRPSRVCGGECDFKRFRGATKTDALYMELKMALDGFAKPLLEVTRVCQKVVSSSAGRSEEESSGEGVEIVPEDFLLVELARVA